MAESKKADNKILDDKRSDNKIADKKIKENRIIESPISKNNNIENISGGNSTYSQRNIKFMKEAIKQAKKAEKINEVPIGCVIVYDDEIIGRGYNRRICEHSALAHAEISAIKKANNKLNDWRLDDCEMYVTLEPCQMCAGAIIQSRIKKVYIACMNSKAGCAGSVLNLLQVKAFNHQAEIETGILEEECSIMLKNFFARLRSEKNTSGNKKEIASNQSNA